MYLLVVVSLQMPQEAAKMSKNRQISCWWPIPDSLTLPRQKMLKPKKREMVDWAPATDQPVVAFYCPARPKLVIASATPATTLLLLADPKMCCKSFCNIKKMHGSKKIHWISILFLLKQFHYWYVQFLSPLVLWLIRYKFVLLIENSCSFIWVETSVGRCALGCFKIADHTLLLYWYVWVHNI